MKNPLNKRIPLELKQDFGKYVIIFAFIVMLISLVSGCLVAGNSMMVAYDEGFDKYQIDNGHITFDREPENGLLKQIEKISDVTLYNLSYINTTDEDDKKYRIYRVRDKVNLECLMEGELPVEENEIAIDRLFAENNNLEIGDTIHLKERDVAITGMVALPDYSCLFEKNTDMMFNATNFTVGVMAEDGFASLGTGHMNYNYAWKYTENISRTDDKLNKDMADDFLDDLKDVITEYDEAILDDAVAAAKLVMLSEMMTELEKSLQDTGMNLSMFDSEEGGKQLLEQVQEVMEQKDINLSEEFGLGKEITFTVEDIERAMHASKADREKAEKFLDTVEDEIIMIEDFLPQYQNQAINFTRSDIGSDTATFVVFGYMVILVIAFVFGVTISNTILAEAGVIGTLRASGYTKGELIRHYMTLPVLVTLVAAIVGNVLGYTVLKDAVANLYYHSYSLTTYETLWNEEAFVNTTMIPVALMFIVNLIVLVRKLNLSPIRFLRHDLNKKGKKKAFRLNTRIPFLHRFRLRVIFQNISNYITLFLGIFLGGVITIFGFMFVPMLEDYKTLALEQRICDYQYVLMSTDAKTENEQAEEYSMRSLKILVADFVEDDVSVYGLVNGSRYIAESFPKEGAMISTAFQKKFGIELGDTIELKDTYTDKTYTFKVSKFYEYDTGFSIFIPKEDYNKKFGEKKDYFTGYFSNEKLTDIRNEDVATIIQISDITKTSDQLLDSMGAFMDLIKYFGVIMFLLLMYLLSKQVIEKNAQSIAMTKILGFENGEIGSIYIVTTTIVVIASLLLTCPLTDMALRYIFKNYLYKMMAGYIPYIISNSCYVKMVLIGIGCFVVAACLQMKKIKKIPKTDALKNVE